MLKSLGACGLALAALLANGTAMAQPIYTEGNRPVMLQADPDGFAPCTAAVIADDEAGSGGVMVFPGDSTDLDYIDTLVAGDAVWLCEVADQMLGIVYSGNPEMDCDLNTPEGADRPYLGPCDWGWVMPQWVFIDSP
ncbi:MAG: hypothetical protein ACXIT4_11880 [Erythrobacter sp.]